MTTPVTSKVVAPGGWQAADTITLDETDRHRRRMTMTSDGGIVFLLDLKEARLLRHGEGLVLDDGRIIAVMAVPEKLYRVSARDRNHLLQLAWHLGNRHCATQIEGDFLLIRHDHTLRAMLEGLDARVEDIEAAFDPEGGAYGDHSGHNGHAHHHGHDHD